MFFLDYYATGRLVPQNAKGVVAGIAEGCRRAECSLVGGETAEMPGMYSNDDFDLAGFAVGIAEKSEMDTVSNVKEGQVILALPSSGVHSNGYSLVRKLLTSVILVVSLCSFWACSDDKNSTKETKTTLLKEEPSGKHAELSQKYFEEGEFKKALDEDKKQLAEDLKYYKKQSPEIALDYNNIGLDYDELKEYTKAIEYYKKAMEIDEKTLDKNSTERSTTYYNFASSNDALGNYDEALKYYLKALNIDKIGLGEFSRDVLDEYENIAKIYEKIGKIDLSIEYYQNIVDIIAHSSNSKSKRAKRIKAKIEALKKRLK